MPTPVAGLHNVCPPPSPATALEVSCFIWSDVPPPHPTASRSRRGAASPGAASSARSRRPASAICPWSPQMSRAALIATGKPLPLPLPCVLHVSQAPRDSHGARRLMARGGSRAWVPGSGAHCVVPVARCAEIARLRRTAALYSYVNSLCRFEYRRWECNLCGTRNRLTSSHSRQTDRHRCPELKSPCYEIELDMKAGDGVRCRRTRPPAPRCTLRRRRRRP